MQETAEQIAVKGASKEIIEAGAVKAGLAAGIGKIVGKALVVDTVIWALPGTVDLGLNLTDMTEEVQIELFEWMGPLNPIEPVGGLSPLGELVIGPALESLFDLVPNSWVESASESLWDVAEYLGLDDFIEGQVESYIESIDLEVSWWLLTRIMTAGVVEGSVIHAAFNPTRVFTLLIELLILKAVWRHVALPFARSLRA